MVEERKFEALWCPEPISTGTSSPSSDTLNNEGCAFVDDDGFIFAPAPAFSGTVFLKFFDKRAEPAAIGMIMMADSGAFGKLRSFKDMLSSINLDTQKIVLKDGGVYEIYLSEGWYIFLDEKSDPRLAFENLKLVLGESIKEKRTKLEYINLRLEKKVFYKLK